jgi:hypothetical protein
MQRSDTRKRTIHIRFSVFGDMAGLHGCLSWNLSQLYIPLPLKETYVSGTITYVNMNNNIASQNELPPFSSKNEVVNLDSPGPEHDVSVDPNASQYPQGVRFWLITSGCVICSCGSCIATDISQRSHRIVPHQSRDSNRYNIGCGYHERYRWF